VASGVTELTVDPDGGRVYCVNGPGGANNGSIGYSSLDGSTGGTVDSTGATMNYLFGIAYDHDDGRVTGQTTTAGSASRGPTSPVSSAR